MMRITTLLALFFVLSFNFYASNHQETFKVVFAKGSYVVDDQVKNNTYRVYRKLPEKAYSKVFTAGEDENDYTPSLKYLLAKNRSIALMKYLQKNGMDSKHVKMNYSSSPYLLVFKDEAEKVEDLIIQTSDVVKNCSCFDLDVAKNNAVVTKNDNYFFIPQNAFQTEQGIHVNKGMVKFCVNEIGLEEKLSLGWHDIKANTVHQPIFEFFTSASFQDQKLILKPYTNIEIHFTQSNNDLNSGKFNWENLAVKNQEWKKNKQENILFYSEKMNLSNFQATDYAFEGAVVADQKNRWVVTLNDLGWNRISRPIGNINNNNAKEVVMADDQPYMMRYVENTSNLVFPIYADKNFNNLYYLDFTSSKADGKIIAHRPDEDSCWIVAYDLSAENSKKTLTVVPEFQMNGTCFGK